MILPLTEQLLESMAFRYDHTFGLDYVKYDFIEWGYTHESREKLIQEMKEMYYLFLDGYIPIWKENATHCQLYEEVTGKGFYKPNCMNLSCITSKCKKGIAS